MKVALQAIERYLPANTNWIYNQLCSFSKFENIVISNYCDEPKKFQLKNSKSYFFPGIFPGNLTFFRKLIRKILILGFIKTGLDLIYFYWKVKNQQPQLLHAHFGPTGWRMIKLAKWLKIPLIVSFYGYDYDYFIKENPNWKQRYSQLFKFGTAFLCEGQFSKQKLIDNGCNKNKIFINHLGVPVNQIPFKVRKWEPGQKLKLCQIASFREKKGHNYTIKAFFESLKYYKNSELTLIGEGELFNEIENLSRKLHIEDNIKIKQIIQYSELYDELHKHHIFIHPSITAEDGDCEGGAPIILLDAQATGMPVITTFHCDIQEEVVEDKSGFLVQERKVDELVKAIEAFINEPDSIIKFGKYGRKHVEKNYDCEKCSKHLETIYLKVIKAKSLYN